MDILAKLGQKIQSERKKLNFSQEELAFESGLHRTYIGSVERGEKNIGLKNLEKIAKALKISITRLVDI